MEWETTIIEIRDKGKLAEFEGGDLFEMANIEIKDHDSLERIYVRAQLCRDPAKLADGDILWVRDYREEIIPGPASIKILKKLSSLYDEYR